MILSLILCALTLGLIYYQVFTQGLFSSMIMAVLSIVAAVVAFNYYEQIAKIMNKVGFLSQFGPKGVSLMAVFMLTLFVLRELTDRFIRGNMMFPTSVDRGGATIFALVSSLIIIGIISIGIQNMPVDLNKLGFQRYQSIDELDNPNRLYPAGDEFLVGMMNQVSTYCFAGKRSFGQYHPNYLRELYLNNLVPEGFEGMRLEASTDALRIDNIWIVDQDVKNNKTRETVTLDENETLIGVEFSFKRSSGDDSRGADDVDKAIRFTPGQIRMVGYIPGNRARDGVCVYPMGELVNQNRTYIPKALDDGYYFEAGDRTTIKMLFKWPLDLKKMAPRHIEFKRSAMAEITRPLQTLAEQADNKQDEKKTEEEPSDAATPEN